MIVNGAREDIHVIGSLDSRSPEGQFACFAFLYRVVMRPYHTASDRV